MRKASIRIKKFLNHYIERCDKDFYWTFMNKYIIFFEMISSPHASMARRLFILRDKQSFWDIYFTKIYECKVKWKSAYFL